MQHHADPTDSQPDPGGRGAAPLPSRAEVVIIGGGVVGASTAYHLTKLGWTDVLLLEQGQLSCGTTWHAAGLVGMLRASEPGTRLVQYSAELYAGLEQEVGLSSGYQRCGGLIVARTPERMTMLRRTAATGEAFGLRADLLTPDEAGERYPIMRTDDLLGAVWLPDDGKANPTDVTAALARGARLGGATIREHTRVTDVLTRDGRVTGVSTDLGDVEARIVVNCAGQWAKAVGDLAGVNVPLHSCEHFYVVTEPFDGVRPDLPVMRDPDGYTYFKEEVGGLVVGGFEPTAKPWVAPDEIPYPFEFQLLGEDWEHFSVLMDNALTRIPALETTGIRKFYDGPESFTPDNNFLMGQAPNLAGFFVGAGFNSVGIASAGGAGRALAEWIVGGEPADDLSSFDLRRFGDFTGNKRWLRDRVAEVLGVHYEVAWPNRELTTARPFRRSPVHHLLAEANASFGSKMGWERPNVFAPAGVEPVIEYGWEKPGWLPWSIAEQRAARQGVCVFDQTSFSKFRLIGPGAEADLQWICAADVAVPVGTVVYTPMLNIRAGYEADLTVTRVAADEYLIVTGAGSAVRDADHIRRNLLPGSTSVLVDVTSASAVLSVMGPRSRDLLARLTGHPLGDEEFACGQSRLIGLGYATARASRVSYIGELGWELYVPAEFAVGALEDLRRAGLDLDLSLGGYYAIESLRLEKGQRAFGHELGPSVTPVGAGRAGVCKLGADIDFIGRPALEKAVASGPATRVVSLVCDDPAVMLWGGELLLRDGRPVGRVSSAAWGAAVGSAVGLGSVSRVDGPVDRDWLLGARHAVNVGGRIVPVALTISAPLGQIRR